MSAPSTASSSSTTFSDSSIRPKVRRALSRRLVDRPVHIPIPPSLLESPLLNSPQSIFNRDIAPMLPIPSHADEQWLRDTVPAVPTPKASSTSGVATKKSRSPAPPPLLSSGANSDTPPRSPLMQAEFNTGTRSPRLGLTQKQQRQQSNRDGPAAVLLHSPPIVRLRSRRAVSVAHVPTTSTVGWLAHGRVYSSRSDPDNVARLSTLVGSSSSEGYFGRNPAA